MSNKDTKSKIPRINLFQQMKLFFETVEENPDFSQTEIALYFFLLNLDNSLAWREWFSLSLSQATGGARLCERTYYKAINRLESLNLIERRKGHKTQAGQIKIVILKAVNFAAGDAVNVPLEMQRRAAGDAVNVPTFIDSKDNKDLKEKKDYLYTSNLFFTSEWEKGVAVIDKFTLENPFDDSQGMPHHMQSQYKELAKMQAQLEEYVKFVKYLKGENQLKKPLTGILSIPGQLSLEQFVSLCGKYYQGGLKNPSQSKLPKAFTDILDQINNTEKYHKGRKELLPILQSWKSFPNSGQTPIDNKPERKPPQPVF